MNDWVQRKSLRLKGYRYDNPGYYFVTICTNQRRENILAEIFCDPAVGAAALGGPFTVDAGTPKRPRVVLTAIGESAARNIQSINHVYNGRASVDCSVIMPDHIHLIIRIHDAGMEISTEEAMRDSRDGPPRAAAPTVALPEIINALKGLSSKEAGYSLWQRGYYDHIIRNQEDLENTRQYIQNNPLKWISDKE